MNSFALIRPSRLALAALTATVTVIALAGCSDTGSSTMPGMDHQTMAPSSPPAGSASAHPAVGTPAPGPHDAADITFAQMMIPHHQQAVQMSEMIMGTPDVPADVTRLAAQIKNAQSPEITQMTGWLTGWGESTTMAMDHDMGDGMMSQTEMDALDQATGTEATRLYLTGMTKHHQGAITMAKAELTDGQNADARKLAQHIIDTQQAEITTMQGILAKI